MNRMYIQGFLAFTIFSSFALVAAGCNPSQTASGQIQAIPSVKVMKMGSAAGSSLMASGKVFPDQEVKVVSKMPGKVALVNVKEGDQVKQGDELVKLEEDDLILQVQQAQSGIAASQAKLADVKAGARVQEIQGLQAAVESAQAALEQAKSNIELTKAAYDMAITSHERIKSLFDSGAASQAELDKVTLELEKAKTSYDQSLAQQDAAKGQLAGTQAKLNLAKSGPTSNTVKAIEADVKRASSGLELAQNALSNTSVKAPISGIVVQRNIEPGEMASTGTPLMTLVKMDKVQIQVSVPQDHINQVKQGTSVEVRVAGMKDRVFKGTVEFVSPVSDQNSTTFPVKLKVHNGEGLLRAGMAAEVYFGGLTEAKLEIPKSALIKKEDKFFVFTHKNGSVHLVQVEGKEKNQDWLYVLSGLKNQDEVVINPFDTLKDGSQVQVK